MKTRNNQKQVSIEEYTEAYCQERRIRGRYAVYVSPETHHSLKLAVGLFQGEFYTTTSSLADAILSQHFKEHHELLSSRLRENGLFPKKPRTADSRDVNEPDETDSESCPDDDSE